MHFINILNTFFTSSEISSTPWTSQLIRRVSWNSKSRYLLQQHVTGQYAEPDQSNPQSYDLFL